jgi:hypothetical protein
MDAETAVLRLVDRFPEVLARVDPPQDAFTASPYLAYGLFAQEVVERKEDDEFLNHASAFMNELAESEDALLEEVLVVSVLERIAEDAIGESHEKRVMHHLPLDDWFCACLTRLNSY